MLMDMWNAPSDRDYAAYLDPREPFADEELELPEVTARPEGECPIISLPPCCYVPPTDDDLPF